MKNNPLDDIIKCDVEISSPASLDAAFDRILIVVPGPVASGARAMEKATAIAKADELLEYGFGTGDAAYLAASVAFSQNPSPDELYVCIRRAAGGGDEGDVEAPAYEDITDTLMRADGEASFYGIHITDFKDPGDVRAAVSWAEANEKLFAFEFDDPDGCPVQNFSFYRSFAMFSGAADGYGSGGQPPENRYAALAWMAKCFGYDPGTETWHLKELSTVVPSALSTDQKKRLEESHINTFLRYAGCNCTIGGYTLAGEWIDVIRFRDWIKAEMQINVFNALKANRKVPYTDSGIGLIEGKMEETLKKGQDIGGIAPTDYDSDANVTPGYTVTVPRASDLTEAERKSRRLTGCRYTARLAGAIHAVEIKGHLTF